MLEITQLEMIVEGLLLTAKQPLSEKQLLDIFNEEERPSVIMLRQALHSLQSSCSSRGINLVELASGYALQVKPELVSWTSRLFKEKPQKYSRSFLETLALIAYRQPITRGEIESIRGVQVNPVVIRTLEERGWIKTIGYRDVPGKPGLLATTAKFLDYFGLKSLQELPSIAEILDNKGVEENDEKLVLTLHQQSLEFKEEAELSQSLSTD